MHGRGSFLHCEGIPVWRDEETSRSEGPAVMPSGGDEPMYKIVRDGDEPKLAASTHAPSERREMGCKE